VESEFDSQKSEINKAKHGIGFVEAQKLWKSKVVVLPARDRLEKRYLAIGAMDSKHWAAIITYRGATIRIISVRRATRSEIEIYEKIAT
jgi:uncharacterized protein